MAGDLSTDPEAEDSEQMINHGTLQLVREAATALAPNGLLFLNEFGKLTADPIKNDHLDHNKWSIHFIDLQEKTRQLGLSAKIISLPKLIGLNGNAQALTTTRTSFATLRDLFTAHGLLLDKRAWLRS